MNPYAQSLLPAAGTLGARGSGLASLLAPLDYPRQSLANAGSKLGGLLSGDTGVMDAIMGMAPALLGGAAGLATGNPLLGAMAAGGLQGLGGATGLDAFNAPTQEDVAEQFGVGDSGIGSMLVNSLIDPMTYVGLPGGMSKAAGTAPAALAAAEATGGLAEKAGLNALLKSGEAATLGEAQGVLGRSLGNVDQFAAQHFPGGELRFGEALNPNATGSTLQEMLGQAADPRMAYVGYNPEVGANLGGLGEFNSLRASRAEAPAVMQYLENSGQALLGPNERGMINFAGPRPAGLPGRTGGWAGVGPGGIPPAPEMFQVGQLPPELLRPQVMPSVNELTLGTQGNQMLSNPTFPQQLSGLTPDQAINLRKSLAGIGQGGVNAVDMPLDMAHALLAREAAASRSQLQQALAAIQQMPPDQQQALYQMFPQLSGGAAPVVPGNALSPRY